MKGRIVRRAVLWGRIKLAYTSAGRSVGRIKWAHASPAVLWGEYNGRMLRRAVLVENNSSGSDTRSAGSNLRRLEAAPV